MGSEGEAFWRRSEVRGQRSETRRSTEDSPETVGAREESNQDKEMASQGPEVGASSVCLSEASYPRGR